MLFSVSFFIIDKILLNKVIDKNNNVTDKNDYNSYNENYSDNTVIRVIDGDTFELANGDIIRMICVDTPEKGKEGYEEAKEFLESLILFKEVQLEKSIDDKDKYGRLLRYVYINYSLTNELYEYVFINKEIIENGYGSVFPYGNNTDCKF